jgi:acetyl esterase/lipase
MSVPVPPLLRSSLFRRAVVALSAVTTLAVGVSAAVAATTPTPTPSVTPTSTPSGFPSPTASPTSTASNTYTTYSGLSYVPNGTSAQTLNLYVPKGIHGPVPLIIYIHGGGWSGGDASELQANSGWQTYLNDGFAMASINYTLSGTAKFPQQIYDVKAAIRYLRKVAPRYHLDGQIGVWGESAGGQLAALAGATCGVAPLEGNEGVTRESSCVQAVVDGMGPTDFLQEDTHLLNSSALLHDPASSPESQYLGCTNGLVACDASTVERANPITYITSSSHLPPYLEVQGDADELVPHWESQILFNALAAACANVTFYTPHGQGHTLFLTGALNPPYPAETVQSSQDCGSPVTNTNGPALSWNTLATFFHAHLH